MKTKDLESTYKKMPENQIDSFAQMCTLMLKITTHRIANTITMRIHEDI